jgi:ubiquinone/menaquinone biosynthesis C-methylase UbiE
MSTIDRDEFRDSQREAWSSVAGGWMNWWRVFENGATRLNERLVERSGAKLGDRVLDVATGIGEPALTAARVVGPDGHVLATDLSPVMLERAAERARDLGITHVEFREADAQELDVEPGSFDAATSRWGLMLMLEPERALARIFAALRPGGGLAAAVWGPPETAPFLATAGRVAVRELGIEPPNPDAPGPFRLSEEGALDRLFEAAGFVDVEHELVAVTMSFATPDEYVAFVGDLSSSLRATLAAHPAEARERVWNGIRSEVAAHCTEAGGPTFDNRSWCVWGRRPA